MDQRIRVGVLFGGRSGEHEVSLVSGAAVMSQLDPDAFEVIPIGLAKDGRWLVGGSAWQQLRAEAQKALAKGDGALVPQTALDPLLAQSTALHKGQDGALIERPGAVLSQLDVIFPVLHGPYGEDGTVQGLLELADLPYVGPGVTASALAMDKVQTKRVLSAAGIPQVDWREVRRVDWERDPAAVRASVEELGYPVFVKPANLGSSVGISKVNELAELDAALIEACRFDRRLIVEAGVHNPREIEVAVLGNDDPRASVCGEIVPGADFYSYEAKYVDDTSQSYIPADLPADLAAEAQELALRAFRCLDLCGLSRVDFLVEGDTDRLFLNEINTIPGFTPISMYPKLWGASGVGYRELLTQLIHLAIERHRDKSRSETSI